MNNIILFLVFYRVQKYIKMKCRVNIYNHTIGKRLNENYFRHFKIMCFEYRKLKLDLKRSFFEVDYKKISQFIYDQF